VSADPRVGVLAIQGDFAAHIRAVEAVGARGVEVRREKDLDGLAALILPGGESTTISKGLDRLGLHAPIEAFARAGRPVLGTCAGAVLLAREVENHPVRSLGLIDAVAIRHDGLIAVADGISQRVTVFDAEGGFLAPGRAESGEREESRVDDAAKPRVAGFAHGLRSRTAKCADGSRIGGTGP